MRGTIGVASKVFGAIEKNKVKGKNKKTRWNHYMIGGLIKIETSDSRLMAYELEGEENYNVRTRHTLINMIVGLLTGGLYTPSTTTVTK